ncbi:MAG: hypothetical protein HZC42_09440 [Candidatus Eisenbacteria bacterium]|nr:hypothetical protein [Candidatus Eisenbacteria bacterium]
MNAHRFARLVLALAATVTLAGGPAQAAKRPPTELLGVRLDMPDHEVQRRLLRIGTLVAGAGTPKQSWALRDRRYGYLVVRYGPDWRVRWVTGFARKEGRRIRYGDIADLKDAQRSGYYIFTWDVTPPGGGESYVVSARGSDSLYVSSVSLSRGRTRRPVPSAAPADTSE